MIPNILSVQANFPPSCKYFLALRNISSTGLYSALNLQKQSRDSLCSFCADVAALPHDEKTSITYRDNGLQCGHTSRSLLGDILAYGNKILQGQFSGTKNKSRNFLLRLLTIY